MNDVSLPFRTALYAKLNPITYMGQNIPVCEEYLNKPAATLAIGNNKPVKAWIQMMNQTGDNNSNKCRRNDLVSIQLQVRVSYNANSGTYEHSDAISDLVMMRLFYSQNEFSITIQEPFNIWNMTMESTRNINFQDNTDRIWMKNILITAQVEQ